MKPFLVFLVTCTFLQCVNLFPTFDKSPLNTNSGGILLKRHPRATAVKSDEYYWPNGEIPYKFNNTFLPEEACLIERAMYHIMWNSCIRFRMKSQNDKHWVDFVNDTVGLSDLSIAVISADGLSIGGISTAGFLPDINEKKFVKISPGSFNIGTIVRLIMHSIGFMHLLPGDSDDTFFDLDSILTPNIFLFKIPGIDTITPNQRNIQLKSLLDKTGLSKLDVAILNKMYKCANPLRPSYDFIWHFVEHYHGCVGKIYNDINRNNSLNKATLKSNKKRSISSNETNETIYDSTIVQGDILIRVNKPSAFPADIVQSSAINPSITVPYSNKTTWTNGTIPYELDFSLEVHKCLIENAMLQIMLNTCIRFRPRNDSDTFYVRIFQDHRYSSCYGYIGMDLQNHVTKVSLLNGCLDIGTVVHELMHAIGFYHHQNRQDRDQHLKIHEKNIKPDWVKNFDLNDPLVEQIITPWDYDSVMLYGAKFFSKDDRSITMEPTVPGVVLKDVYDKPGLSKFDALAINRLYECPNVSNPQFYSDLSLMKPMLKLVESCNSSSPENVKSYQYIFK